MQKKQTKIKKLTVMAALTASALIVFVIELQVPLPIPVPGAKLGLANTFTLFALFYSKRYGGSELSLTTANAFEILICRILLGAIFTGRFVALAMSLSGGILAFIIMAVTKRYLSDKQIWVSGALGAIFHNIGQIAAAILIIGTPAIAAYLPILTIIGIITGTITGLITQVVLGRIKIQSSYH